MEQLVDLHTHSTASDGQYPPATLVEKAAAAGIQLLALTDHDTMDGLEEAIQAGAGLSVTVLRGIELGAREDRHMHILGLNLSADCPELAELCRVLKASREERKYRILSFLAERGVPVSLEEVEAQAGGDHIAACLGFHLFQRGGSPGRRRCDRPAALCASDGAPGLCLFGAGSL